MRIALVRPTTFLNMDTYPLNIGYIYSALSEDSRFEPAFIDGEKIGARYLRYKGVVERDPDHIMWDEIAGSILRLEPDVVAFSCYSVSMTATKYIIDRLRVRYCYEGQIWIGGIHATTSYGDALEKIDGLNGAVIGEGERSFKEALKAISDGRELSGVNGIAYKTDGDIKVNSNPHLIDDLNDLPIPQRLFPGNLRYGNHIMLTSRGCPYNCDFCNSKDMWTHRVRYRSGEHVAREVESIAKVGIYSVGLRDDTFTLNMGHMEEVYRAINDRGLSRMKFNIGSRIDTIDNEKIALLKKMNTSFISFGVETGNPSVQKRIKKNLDLDKVLPVIRKVNAVGIRTITFFMLGHPGETEEEITDTFSLIQALAKDCKKRNMLSINIVCPYPGTNYWFYAKERHGEFIDFYTESFKYYHQAGPIINITAMDEKIFVRYISRIKVLANASNTVYNISTALENPNLLISKAKKVFSRN